MNDTNRQAGGPLKKGRRRVQRAGPYDRPGAAVSRPLPPPQREDDSAHRGWGSYARSFVVTPIKAAANYTGSWFGRRGNPGPTGNENSERSQHSGSKSVSCEDEESQQSGEESSGQVPDTGMQHQLELPATSATAGVPRSQSQVAVITSREARDLGSAISPQPQWQPINRVRIADETILLANGSPATPHTVGVSTTDVEALPAGGTLVTPQAAVITSTSPAAATPFDNVLSVLDRIKQRPHTPWVPSTGGAGVGRDVGGLRKSYSPVHFQGNGHAQGPRSSSRAPRPSPYGAPIRGFPRPSRLAQASAQTALSAAQLVSQDSSKSGGQLFLGQPVDVPPPSQSSSIFAHASGTPLASSRFARRLSGINGAALTPRTLPVSTAGPRGALASTATPHLLRAASRSDTPMPAAAPSMPLAVPAMAGGKRGRADTDDESHGAAATPLLGSGYDAETHGSGKRQRSAVVGRRTWRTASPGVFLHSRQSQQPLALEAAPSSSAEAADGSDVSTNAARRILMALETMSSPASGEKNRRDWDAPPPPTASLGPPTSASGNEGWAAAPGAESLKVAGKAEKQPSTEIRAAQLPLTLIPPASGVDTAHHAEVNPMEALASSTTAKRDSKSATVGGWGDMLSKNKEQETKATAAFQAEIEKDESGTTAAPQIGQPFDFGVPSLPPAASTPQQPPKPKSTFLEVAASSSTYMPAEPSFRDEAAAVSSPPTALADSTNLAEGRTFEFATKKAKRRSRKVAAVLAKVLLSEKSTSEPDRSFRFGLPLEERSNSGSEAEAAASPQDHAQASANSQAAAAAHIPLPDDSDAVLPSQLDRHRTGQSRPTDTKAGRPSGLLDFLNSVPTSSSTAGPSFDSQSQPAKLGPTAQSAFSSSFQTGTASPPPLGSFLGRGGGGGISTPSSFAPTALALAPPSVSASLPASKPSALPSAATTEPAKPTAPAFAVPASAPQFSFGTPPSLGITSATAVGSAADVPSAPPPFDINNSGLFGATTATTSAAAPGVATTTPKQLAVPPFGFGSSSALGAAHGSSAAAASTPTLTVSETVAPPASVSAFFPSPVNAFGGGGVSSNSATKAGDARPPAAADFGAPLSSQPSMFGTPALATQTANGVVPGSLTRQNSIGANSNMSTMSGDEKSGGGWQPDMPASSFAHFGAGSSFAFGQSESTPAFAAAVTSTAAGPFGVAPPLIPPSSLPQTGFGFGGASLGAPASSSFGPVASGGFAPAAPPAAQTASLGFGGSSSAAFGGINGAAPAFSFGANSSTAPAFAFGGAPPGQTQPAASVFGVPAAPLSTTQLGVMSESQTPQPGQFGGGIGGGMTLGGAPGAAASRAPGRKMLKLRRPKK